MVVCNVLQEFFMDMKDVDRDNEVNRILGAFKLNPFEQLGINFDCTMEDIRRQYRKVSLMVHPDKCKHPRATDAFEVLGNANKALSDEENVRELRHALTLARGMCSISSLHCRVALANVWRIANGEKAMFACQVWEAW